MRKLLALVCLLLMAGNACASVALRTDSGAALADRNGNETVPFGTYADIIPLGRGLYAAVQDEKSALMDGHGILLTDFDFESIVFKEDLLLGSIGGRWCILNPDGSACTEAVYGMITPDGTGGAWAIRGTNGDMVSDELLLLDANGAEAGTGLLVRRMDEHAGSGRIALLPTDDASYVYCDAAAQIAFDQSFQAAGCFTNGAAIVAVGGKYAAINAEGEIILPAEYDFVAVSDGGTILAVNDSAVLAVGSDGAEYFYYEGEHLSAAFVGEHILIYDGERLLVYAADGSLQHELPADAAVYPGLDGQLILSDGAWGEKCVSIAGDDKMYQNLYPLGYAGGEAVYVFMEVRVAKYMNNLLGEVQFSADMVDARYGIAGSNGEALLPAIYERVDYLDDDRFLVRIDSRWRMIDSRGTIYWQREDLSGD